MQQQSSHESGYTPYEGPRLDEAIYQSPIPPQPPARENWVAVDGLIVSILSVPLCGIGFFGLLPGIALLINVIGLVLALRWRTGRGLAIAGMIISSLPLLFVLCFFLAIRF